MPSIEIRRLEGEEAAQALLPLSSYAFFPSPPLPDPKEFASEMLEHKGQNFYALFEDSVPVSSAIHINMTENVRGRIYPASGVGAVTTHPGWRRKGYSTQMLAKMFRDSYEAGVVFECLYPFLESFYGRMGFAAFPPPLTAKTNSNVFLPLLKQDLPGRVELKLISEVYGIYRDFIGQMQAVTHGMARFEYGNQPMTQKYPAWAAMAYVDGTLEGIMLYKAEGGEPYPLRMHASRFYALSSQGRALLLAWIAGHAGQMDEVTLSLGPFERPRNWLNDLKMKVETQEVAPMGRVLDVEHIGGMQIGPGSFSAQISDPFCPWNEGTWRFENQDGSLQVAKAEKADCRLTIQGLSALVYGTNDPQDFALRGWGDPEPGVQAAMRSMFPLMLPHMHEDY